MEVWASLGLSYCWSLCNISHSYEFLFLAMCLVYDFSLLPSKELWLCFCWCPSLAGSRSFLQYIVLVLDRNTSNSMVTTEVCECDSQLGLHKLTYVSFPYIQNSFLMICIFIKTRENIKYIFVHLLLKRS